jgi:uncharacterized membrane protein YvbJ
MKKKILIALILIIALVVIAIGLVANPQMSLKVVGEQAKDTVYPDRLMVKIKYTNPTQFTLYDIKITVQYLRNDSSYHKFEFYDSIIEPLQEESHVVEVESLYPDINSVQNGFICEGYGYMKPQPTPWNSPVL